MLSKENSHIYVSNEEFPEARKLLEAHILIKGFKKASFILMHQITHIEDVLHG